MTLSLNAREDSKWYFVSILYFNWSNDLVQPVGETGFKVYEIVSWIGIRLGY